MAFRRGLKVASAEVDCGTARASQSDPDRQQIINQVAALASYHLERKRGAGYTADEIAEARTALVAGIIEALRTPQP